MTTEYQTAKVKIGNHTWKVTAFDTSGGFVTLQSDDAGDRGFPEICIYMSPDNASDLGHALINANLWTITKALPPENPDHEELPF